MYIGFVKAYLQVHEIYKPFLTKHFHQKEAFPTTSEAAKYFDDFNNSNFPNFKKIKCKLESFGYKSLKGKNSDLILCEEIGFNDLSSFLYYEFFNGIKQNYVPNQCKNCGKFFLLKSSWYYSFCDRKLKKEPTKTCRDVGSKRRYEDKCKNNPIWQTYNRAYKAHYARYIKKKMTVAEFEEWSRFASEIRDKALAGEIMLIVNQNIDKIQSLPVILLITSEVKEQIVSQSLSITLSRVLNTSFLNPRLRPQ